MAHVESERGRSAGPSIDDAPALASVDETGSLGLRGLKRMWSRALRARAGLGAMTTSDDARGDDLLLLALALHREETLRYLHFEAPTFDRFERWILERNGGSLDPARLRRLAAAQRGEATAPELAPGDVLAPSDLAFFREHGYVVVREALDASACVASERAIWDALGMDPSEPDTWYSRPFGHSIWVPLLRHPALVANRASPRIARAFAQLWNDDDLWATTDRTGFNPPERPDWPFPGPHLHWDCSLIAPVVFDLGGLLYLTDTPEHHGAFRCVPGFHRRIDAWLAALEGADPRAQDLEALGARSIAAGAGDLVIWHQALPHGAAPNRGTRPRIVQYLTMRPSTYAAPQEWR